MANNIIAMDSLKEGAVRVYTGMIAVFPQFSQEEALSLSELAPKFNGCYATNNSTVCFVSDNEIFVTPYTRSVVCTLRSLGFSEKHFYVPFSNGDFPKSAPFKWNALRERARQSYKADFVSDCEAYCDERHIGFISEKTLANCFEVPENGVRVKKLSFEGIYYPVMNQSCLDCRFEYLGHFCYNNGRVVFIYRNGKTYVAKGYGILNELRAAGYTESGLFVPFSNGEEIQDYALRVRWESITKC